MFISIIIPTYNEANNIGSLIRHLSAYTTGEDKIEIIVSDGESEDNTLSIAKEAAIAVVSPAKGRAGQMNYAAKQAKGDVLYFVHADTIPPASYYTDIAQALNDGYNCGSYRFRFNSNKFMLKINAFFTRFNYLFFRGGDQSIFVTKELFEKVGPYKEDMLIMEDYDFLQRIWKAGKFKLIPKSTLVSARKYDNNTWLQVQLANLKVVRMYRNGASQDEMIRTYNKMLNYRKNAF